LTQIKLAARSLPTSSAGRPCGSSILKPHVNNPCVAPPSSIPAPALHSTRAAHSQGAPPVAAISPMQPLLPPSVLQRRSSMHQSSLIQPCVGTALKAGSSVLHHVATPPALCPMAPHVAINPIASLLRASVLPHPGMRRHHAQHGHLSQAPCCRSSHLEAHASGRGS
jgi:hypothetical protein